VGKRQDRPRLRRINGVYTQAYNRRHRKVGHLFQGRFKAILVDRDAYLLEVCRYVDLNPVRANMVPHPADWPWSSYRAHVGSQAPPSWLDTPSVHGYLLGRDVANGRDAKRAAQRYEKLVEQGKDVRLWDAALRQQIYLGDDSFIQRMQSLLEPERKTKGVSFEYFFDEQPCLVAHALISRYAAVYCSARHQSMPCFFAEQT